MNMPVTEPAILTRGLTRRFDATTALVGLDLRVERGELFGLVGPDGAGKSTAIRLLTATLSPSGGEAQVVGFDVAREAERVRERAGYVAQHFALYGDLTVGENITFQADIFGIAAADRRERTAELLAFSGLAAFGSRRAEHLSGGMKRKLALACALIHRPEILFLDEPTAGVDPISRLDLWRILDRLRAEGLTIVFTTAYMDEAERCDRLAFLAEGRLVAAGSPAELRGLVRDAIFEVRGDDLGLARDLAIRLPGVSGAQLMGDRLHIAADPALLSETALGNALLVGGAGAASVERVPPSLEDVFVARRAAGLSTPAETSPVPDPFSSGEGEVASSAPPFPRGEGGLGAMGTPPAVEVRGLVRRFGAFTAVGGIDFEVRRGEVFGFLGPNGSGKTTTIRMLCGILPPSGGEARVLGRDCWRESDAVKPQIGYMSQKFALYEDLTVVENLRFYARIYGVPPAEQDARIAASVSGSGLRGREREVAGGLGGGLRQRLAFGCATLHRPPVIFLDEPTAGVDPVARREFWDVIYALARDGATVFVTTHYMDEAEYCNRLALMHAGRLIALDTPDGLRSRLPRTDAPASLEEVFVALVGDAREN